VALVLAVISLVTGACLLRASENKPGYLKTSAAFFLILGIIFTVGWFFGIFREMSVLMGWRDS
jgi:hypothetical protein